MFHKGCNDMAANTALYILKILQEKSDIEHQLTKNQIIEELNNYTKDIIEEKQFFRKIDELISSGFPIVKTRGRYSTYYYDGCSLTSAEMLYIYTLIKTNKSISIGETDFLITELNKLVPLKSKLQIRHKRMLDKMMPLKDTIDNVSKFKLIIDAIENNDFIRYKVGVQTNQSIYVFSDYRFLKPQQYLVIDNHLVVKGIMQNKEAIEVNLESMFNVEIAIF